MTSGQCLTFDLVIVWVWRRQAASRWNAIRPSRNLYQGRVDEYAFRKCKRNGYLLRDTRQRASHRVRSWVWWKPPGLVAADAVLLEALHVHNLRPSKFRADKRRIRTQG